MHPSDEAGAPAEPARNEGPEPVAQGSCSTLEIHEIALLFPEMSEPEFAALLEDMRVNGQREAMWTHQGKVIDGRHRLKACRSLGRTPILREWDGKGSLLEFVIGLNLRRRHLKETQRAMIAARMMPKFEEEARQREHAGKRVDNTDEHPCHFDPRRNCDEGRATRQAGTLFNVSRWSVERARKVLEKGCPALIEAVDRSKIAVSTAAALAERSQDEQANLLKLGRSELANVLRPTPLSPPGEGPASAASLGGEGSSASTKVPQAPPNIPSARWSENPDQRTADEWLERNFPAGRAKLKKTEHGFVLEFIGGNQEEVRADIRTAVRDERLLLGLLRRGVWMVWKESA